MSSMFEIDGSLFRILNRIGDLVILNILWVFFSLPIITAGASLQALDYVLLQIIRKEDPQIVKSFWRSFKLNFVQSTKLWIFFILCVTVLTVDVILSQSMYSPFRQIFMYLCVFGAIIIFSMILYAFPLVGRFENSIKGILKNSFLLTIGHAPKTIMMLICWLIPIIIIGLDVGLLLFFAIISWIIGISGICYLNCIIINGIFKQMEEECNDH